MARAAKTEDRVSEERIYLGLELGMDKWVLCFSRGEQYRTVMLLNPQNTVARVISEGKKIAQQFGVRGKCRVVSCYEAGRHAFSVHRELAAQGITNLVVDPASIEVPRRARRNKTDRMDAKALVRLLKRHQGGEPEALHVVRVPTVEQEDERRPQRELMRLTKERSAIVARMKSLLATMGVRLSSVTQKFPEFLNKARQFDGRPLPKYLVADLLREHERWQLLVQQMKEIKTERRARVKAIDRTKPAREQKDSIAAMVAELSNLCGVGEDSAWLLATEFFAWRNFENRRQVGGSAGLVPTLHESCTIQQRHGISKAGNRRVRWIMQELGHGWLLHNQKSALSQEFRKKYASAPGDMRRSGFVALARKLLVAFWKYLEFGEVPKGAEMKDEKLALPTAA